MSEEYIVLRRSPSMGGVQYPPSEWMPYSAGPDIPQFSIDFAPLTKAERADLRRDPRTAAISAPMPMKLVPPVSSIPVEKANMGDVTWGLQAVGAHGSRFTGEGVVVAILDTGIDASHAAFKEVTLVQRNFTSESDEDQDGHGTHCAGTIFGQDIDGLRIGVARNVERALIGKVLGQGDTSSLTVARAIEWAVTEGAHIVSLSLALDFPGYVENLVKNGMDIQPATSKALEGYRANIALFRALIETIYAQGAFQEGTLVIAASGNESRRPNYEIAVAPPAAGDGVMAVGALQRGPNGLSVAPFSNTRVELSAPGVEVVSAKLGGGVFAQSGTSMAAPHAAGVAALWAQKQRSEIGRVDSKSLWARVVASGNFGALASGAESEDVGTGLVRAPSP